MAKLVWDASGAKKFETGVDHGVLYPASKGKYPKGVVWNGLTSVSESPSGADENKFYADNIVYGSLRGAEDFGGTIECYTYPDEWGECDGSIQPVAGVVLNQQVRKAFGLSYRTVVSSDAAESLDVSNGYKLHLVWNATASPSERQYQTINDSPEAISFSYEFTTNPIAVSVVKNAKPVSLITVDSTVVDAEKLAALETKLYGDDASGEAQLPLPDEVLTTLGYTAE